MSQFHKKMSVINNISISKPSRFEHQHKDCIASSDEPNMQNHT